MNWTRVFAGSGLKDGSGDTVPLVPTMELVTPGFSDAARVTADVRQRPSGTHEWPP
jgi:hypothetical protein